MNGPEFGIGQLSGDRSAVLRRLVQLLLGDGCERLDALEVGSYEGGSALVLSHAIGERVHGSVTCVDPWKPYLPKEDVSGNETCRHMEEDLASGVAFNRFVRNIKHEHKNARISFYIGTLRGVLRHLSFRTFDLVFIDGSHAFEDVRHDLRAAVKLVKDGGILCGDDLEKQFGDETFNPEHAAANQHREFTDGYHPGVTLAVYEVLGRVWCEYGVWAARKEGCKWSAPS